VKIFGGTASFTLDTKLLNVIGVNNRKTSPAVLKMKFCEREKKLLE
jgi:hypothetical protein